VARHSRSPLAPQPSWLRDRRPRLGRREIWATIRAHPRSLWELGIYVAVVIALTVITDEVFGASSILTTVIPSCAGFLGAGLYVGKLEALRRRDLESRSEGDPIA
jgi:hypothetical protein